MTKKRIETLRKEKLMAEGAGKGISKEFIADFTINVKEADMISPRKLRTNIINSLARQLRSKYRQMKSVNELVEFINDVISFGSTKIDIGTIENDEQKVQGEVIRLLSHITKVKQGSYNYDNYSAFLPVSIVIEKHFNISSGMYREFDGYAFGTETLPKSYRGGKWGFRGSDNHYLNDLGELTANVFFMNVIEEFILSNKETYFYIVTKKYVRRVSKNEENINVITLPDNELAPIIKSYIEKYDLVEGKVKFVKDENKNRLVDHFCLDEYILNRHDKQDEGLRSYVMTGILDVMFVEFLESTSNIVLKVDQEIRNTTHARAFETKKNINQATKEAMKHNHFLNRYGYVEIDNDVDLIKFNQLSEEFKSLSKLIYIPEAEDHSFRIKKLGRHRAAGIYFSGIKSTIIDIGNPDSYIHELGHQIDFTFGQKTNLSNNLSFRYVVDEYKRLVRREVDQLDRDDQFLKSWLGNTSYNSSYYFQPTEIFARSYELYVEAKGIETSFLKESLNTPVYPKDEGFIERVIDYFDNLFSFFEPVEEDEIEKETMVASALEAECRVIEYEGSEQLALF